MQEVKNSMNVLKDGKVAGIGEITGKIIKNGVVSAKIIKEKLVKCMVGLIDPIDDY